jgi:hypothetical protein
MTDFFEPPPPLPEPELPQHWPWHGPPGNVVGAGVALEVVLARTPDLALSLERFAAYPTGFKFRLVTRSRTEELGWDLDQAFFGRPFRRPRSEASEIPPERLRFGIQFADGSKATNLNFSHAEPGKVPSAPVMSEGGGGGGGRLWEHDYWVWPLPVPGPLAFVCEWPAHGIPFTRVEIDADRILQAVPRAQVLWAEEETGPGGGNAWTSSGPV